MFRIAHGDILLFLTKRDREIMGFGGLNSAYFALEINGHV